MVESTRIVWLTRFVAVALTAAFVVPACGGALDAPCGDYYDTLAAYGDQCAGEFAPPAGPQRTNQRTVFVQTCDALGSAPGMGQFASQLATCTNTIQADVAQCAPFRLDYCGSKGTLPNGAACAVDVQCSSGNCANETVTSATTELVCGTCADYLQVGASCADGTNLCDPSASSCINGTCVAYVSQGGACGGAQGSCSPFIVPPITCASGTCQPYPAQGQACTDVCQAPYRCVGGTCQTGVPPGGPCPNGVECADTLCDETHTCASSDPFAQAGQPCGGTTLSGTCDMSLACVQATCTPIVVGMPCTVGDFQCDTLTCVNGACAVPDYSQCK